MISIKEKMFLQKSKELNRFCRDTAKAQDKV